MKNARIIIASSAAITMSFNLFAPALASTNAYVTGGLLSGGLNQCLENAKKAATKAGFTESQEVVFDDDKKAGDFHANQKGSTLHMTMRCDPPQGVWSVAVSGVDNEQTFKGYNEVLNSFD
jgi:hypothetical protein